MNQSEIVLAQNIRNGLIGVLKLWASKDSQIEYQNDVPIANVSAELFCQWCDDYYNEENPIMLKAFSQIEFDVFAEFNNVICKISDTTPLELPSIHQFIKTREWEVLNHAAISALTKLGLE